MPTANDLFAVVGLFVALMVALGRSLYAAKICTFADEGILISLPMASRTVAKALGKGRIELKEMMMGEMEGHAPECALGLNWIELGMATETCGMDGRDIIHSHIMGH